MKWDKIEQVIDFRLFQLTDGTKKYPIFLESQYDDGQSYIEVFFKSIKTGIKITLYDDSWYDGLNKAKVEMINKMPEWFNDLDMTRCEIEDCIK